MPLKLRVYQVSSELYSAKSNLLVIGDYLEDVYLLGHWDKERFKVRERLVFPGGALNVDTNLRAILDKLGKTSILCNIHPLQLIRLCDTETNKKLETYLEITNENCLTPYQLLSFILKDRCPLGGIVVSDYNKGIANKSWWRYLDTKDIAPFVIVDSRYRSTHKDYINMGKVKIWRCTENEYDNDWAQQFDYVVWTHGAGRIQLRDLHSSEDFIFTVPKIDPVDTCGAGDTFTAALAASLRGLEPTLDDIRRAIPFCIEAAQDVCLKPYTAITSKRLIG